MLDIGETPPKWPGAPVVRNIFRGERKNLAVGSKRKCHERTAESSGRRDPSGMQDLAKPTAFGGTDVARSPSIGAEAREEGRCVLEVLVRAIVAAVVVVALLLPVRAETRQESSDSTVSDSALQAFYERIGSYVTVRDRLAEPLPPMTAATGSWSMMLAKRYLASAIRAARPAARGNVFNATVTSFFRHTISETLQSLDFTEFVSELIARSGAGRGIHPVVNEPYYGDVAERAPHVLARVLPNLPAGLEYRIAGYDLLLLDVYAEIVVDYVPDAFALDALEDE